MSQPGIFDADPTLLDTFTSVIFYCPGHPAPQGSKSPFRNKYTGRIHMTESSKKVGPWRERVALAAHNAMLESGLAVYGGPVSVTLEFVLTRPKSCPKRSTPPAIKRNGDIDKLARSILDSITGVIVLDDAQVVELHAGKRIAEIGETAGVQIRVDVAC
jgi:crossover junction endodeoxyribonuclease RusA